MKIIKEPIQKPIEYTYTIEGLTREEARILADVSTHISCSVVKQNKAFFESVRTKLLDLKIVGSCQDLCDRRGE